MQGAGHQDGVDINAESFPGPMNATNRNILIFKINFRAAAAAKRRLVPALVCLLALLVESWGCSPRATHFDPASTVSDAQPLLILPFVDLTKIYGETSMIKCPLCANYFAAGKVAPGAETFMTETLVEILERTTQFQILTRPRVRHDPHQPVGVRLWEQAERTRLVEAGHAAGTELVMTGYIYRFRQRVGSRYAAVTPASVALSVHMVSAADGRDLWYGTVDDTQSALSEDLFKFKTFLKRKGTWVTAEQMAESELEALLEKLPLK
jgi:hypothetical protein